MSTHKLCVSTMWLLPIFTAAISVPWEGSVKDKRVNDSMLVSHEPLFAPVKSSYIPLEHFGHLMRKNRWHVVENLESKPNRRIPIRCFLNKDIRSIVKSRGEFAYYQTWVVSTLFKPVKVPARLKQQVHFNLASSKGDRKQFEVILQSGKRISLYLCKEGSQIGNAQIMHSEVVNRGRHFTKTYLLEEQTVVVDRFGNELIRGFSGVTTMLTLEKKLGKKRGKVTGVQNR